MAHTSPHLRHMTFNQTFESSLVQRNNEKFTVDKSLIKGIKQNDVSKIIERGQDGGLQDTNQLYNELQEIQTVVIDTRKRYDEIKTLSLKTEKEIQNLRNKKEILGQDSQKYNSIIEKQRKELETTKSKLSQVSFTMQATLYRKDTYDYLKDVLKKDILVLKKRYFDKDVQLMRDRTKLKSIRTQHSNKIKLSKRCRQMLDSMEKTVNQKQYERTTKINSFCDVLARKQINQRNKQIRSKQIQQAMVTAMTDKLQEQKQWIKILHSNLFLKGVLKTKMQRLMEEHNNIELAFHKMKQQTSIKTANDFIQKFLTREETYGLLLQSISQKQEKLEQIKQERDILQKSYNQTLYKSEVIAQQSKKTQTGPQINYKSVLEELNEQLLTIQRQKQLIYQWGTKFLSSYHGTKSRTQIAKQYDKNSCKELFLEVLKVMNGFLDQLQKQQNSDKKIDQVYFRTAARERILTQEMSDRNTRIKTLSTYDNDPIYDIEDKDVAYDDLSQVDYLQHNRRAIKKNDLQNRRFRIKTKPY